MHSGVRPHRMKLPRVMKSAMMVVAGLCWLVVAFLICVFLFKYLASGGGLQVFGSLSGMSSPTVSVGLVHFVGFMAAACLCFIIGVGLCAHGLCPGNDVNKQ